LQTIRTSTALLVTASDSKKKLEPKHAFEGEREATVGWVVAGSGWWQGGDGVGIGIGVGAELWPVMRANDEVLKLDTWMYSGCLTHI
jgi:hypothetical protein